MARESNRAGPVPDIRVVIRNTGGQYLAGDPSQWFFTDDRSAAVVFHYDADHVVEQIETIRQLHGVVLKADPVPQEEIYEMCDRCGELFMPFMIFFDGRRFLCGDCRRPAAIHVGQR